MSDLDAREVLLYLNQLGYQNITAKQLKEFMKDLKKLIKYEKKHTEADNENFASSASVQCNRLPCSDSAPTDLPTAKDARKKEQIVSVKIKRPTRACHCTDAHSKDKPTGKQSLSAVSCSEPKLSSDVPETISEAASSKRPKSCDIECQKSKVKFKRCALRPKSSFIVPRQPIKICKTDPVALYHKYQELWKREKIPGESSHSDLRWAIREQMLGRPQAMSAAPSMEVIARKRRNTDRI